MAGALVWGASLLAVGCLVAGALSADAAGSVQCFVVVVVVVLAMFGCNSGRFMEYYSHLT